MKRMDFNVDRHYSPESVLPADQLLLTKGDNNHVDDIELYQGLDWLERRHIVGKVRG
jgi:signal peptidase